MSGFDPRARRGPPERSSGGIAGLIEQQGGVPPTEEPEASMAPPSPEEGGQPLRDMTEEEELDVKIGTNSIRKILQSEEGKQMIQQLSASHMDTTFGAAMLVMQATNTLLDSMQESGLEITPASLLSPGGIVENVINDIGDILESDGVEFGQEHRSATMEEVMDMVKSIAQSAEGQQTAGAQQPQEGASPLVPPTNVPPTDYRPNGWTL